MKNYKKYIFDLDNTLLIPDWSKDDDYLKENIPIEEQEAFFKQKQTILDEYEMKFSKYEPKTLSEFFEKFGFHISEEIINGWMIYSGETTKDEIADGVLELFEYLKNNNKEIIILTSWFSKTQIPRLKRTGLYNYIDKIIAGEDAMKPNIEAFELAIGNTNKEDCIMIGDSIKSDKMGAERAGIDYYIVDNEHSIRNLYEEILKL